MPLDEVKGIDILGDLVEASDLSPNPTLYGSLHNMGHNVIAYSHDPVSVFRRRSGPDTNLLIPDLNPCRRTVTWSSSE